MLPSHRIATHPGQILLQEFLEPMGLTQAELARALSIPLNRVNELVRGKRGVTPKTALLLASYFKNSAEFWMNLQTAYDLTQRSMKWADALWRLRGEHGVQLEPASPCVSQPTSNQAGQSGSAITAIPAVFAASRIFSPSSNKHFPASRARQDAPAACMTSIVFNPITGTSKRIS